MDSKVETTTEDDIHPESVEESHGMRQVWMLAISLSILQVGFGIVTPIFPFYIVELGVGGTELGVLAASFAITRIILAGPLGGLSDKVGRRPVLLGALIGFAFANVVYAFATNIITMILVRALEGAVSAGFFPAANAYVSDVTTPQNRGAAMGYLSMGNMVGFIVGPTVGGVLAQFLGIRLPFIIAGLAALATFVAVFALVAEPKIRSDTTTEVVEKVSIRESFALNRRAYSGLGVAMFANMFALGILEVAFVLDAVERFGISPLEIGVFFGVIGVVMIIGNIVFGKLSDRVGRKWLIVGGALIGAFSLLLFVIADSTLGFVIAGAVLAVGMSMRGPTIQALIGDLTDRRHYGTMMGAFGAVSNGAYAVSPLLGGVMYDTYSSSAESLLLASSVSLTGAIAAGITLPRFVPRTVSESEQTGDQVTSAAT
ncbi:MAG: MFS transporter [Candidatus Thorarchaeota archaeon]|nr:MAG: MFS transporter [Candidatus Thorarchaeota archaeon]